MFSESKTIVSEIYSEEGSSTFLWARHLENHEVLTVFMLTANRDVFSNYYFLLKLELMRIEPQSDLSLIIRNSHYYYPVFYFFK